MNRMMWVVSMLLVVGLASARQKESLNRAVVAVRQADGSVFVSWRLLESDPSTITFDVYRAAEGGEPVKLNEKPIDRHTWFLDSIEMPTGSLTYFVEGEAAIVGRTAQPYLSVPLQIPPDGSVDGRPYSYTANDASVGDLDGDGSYEIVLKWEPSMTRNPPQKGLRAANFGCLQDGWNAVVAHKLGQEHSGRCCLYTVFGV